ncbi:hypothetical protein BG015_004076 [Linnemannia schmuckeri]|uniref:Uncharacterized protein n=1 Tax=Linnemannia schmuckeri TaxID=64567 RepID=A0A9P5S2D0_9FUNG|nr:hypothetical protein BG015_004076 [Linnemannia schmuckeri]
MKTLSDSKNSNSFELVSIVDHSQLDASTSEPPHPPPSSKPQGCCSISPRGRLTALASYLLIAGLSSLYFCLVQAGMDSIHICDSIANCLLFSTQGWPAMGDQSVDLLAMSYISGTISVVGGILGAFGIFAAYKESSTMVRFFAKVWWIMIGVFLGSTALTLFLTVIHKDRFLDQCGLEHDAARGTSECGAMYVAALLGSLIGCLIGVTMIWCYGEDVVRYSIELGARKDKQRRVHHDNSTYNP